MNHQKLLFLSNGHGEDLNATLILQALRTLRPEIGVAAMPIVGAGKAYTRLAVPIIGPTATLPSGGFNYIHVGRLLNPRHWGQDTNPVNLMRDLTAGLVGLTWQQLQATRLHSRQCDLLFAVGDIVPILFAWLTGRPFAAFLVSTSSYYEGRVKLPWLTQWALRSPRCRQIFTRDAYTAEDLKSRGFQRVTFAGYPIMDTLTPTGRDLGGGASPLVALLPGSRLPEAVENFGLMLQLCSALSRHGPFMGQAALVPSFTPDQVQAVAQQHGWTGDDQSPVSGDPRSGWLRRDQAAIAYHYDAFADILHQCAVVVGMAGTAVEQAVGLGKPVVQIPGRGPQFTYPFAEAQERLLGPAVQTIGREPATAKTLAAAAEQVAVILQDGDYRQRCEAIGQVRVGPPGGSRAIAQQLLQHLA
jgi:uncharacterized protein (TIGR03492 family)